MPLQTLRLSQATAAPAFVQQAMPKSEQERRRLVHSAALVHLRRGDLRLALSARPVSSCQRKILCQRPRQNVESVAQAPTRPLSDHPLALNVRLVTSTPSLVLQSANLVHTDSLIEMLASGVAKCARPVKRRSSLAAIQATLVSTFLQDFESLHFPKCHLRWPHPLLFLALSRFSALLNFRRFLLAHLEAYSLLAT